MSQIDHYAKIVYEYMLMHQEIKKADAIFVLGSNDVRVAERGAELYLQGYAPIIICSGGNGKRSDFSEPEAKIFSERMIELGVPKEKIILEPNSSNTGENVRFTKELLERLNIQIKSVIAVQKPYMERRTYATIKKQWPEIDCVVTSTNLSYEKYPLDETHKTRFINVMTGDLIRIREYPKLGFQVEQEIPEEVWWAGQELIKFGFDKYANLAAKPPSSIL